jgi:propanol-preferring alcohol dehydrogenase
MNKRQSSNWTLVCTGSPLSLMKQDIPEPQGTQVLLEVTHCGVCHSDLYFQDGFYDLGGGKKLSLADRGVKLPMVPGHETVGTVVAMGPDAQGVSIGDSGIAFPWAGCGACSRCLNGNEHLCFNPRTLGVFHSGGYGTHVLLQRPEHLINCDGIDPALAATYACSGVTAISAVKKLLPLSTDEAVVIFGAGGLGLAAIAIVRALGPNTRTVVVDISDERLDMARAAGASACVNAREDGLAAKIQAAAGQPISGSIDFVGSTQTAEASLAALAKGGKYIIVGLYGGGLQLQLPLLPLRAISIVGSYVGSLADLRELVALAKAGTLAPTPVERVSHDDPNSALDRLRSGRVAGRLVLSTQA